MVRIVEALSGLSRARPLVSHPGQSLAIAGGSTLRQVESTQDFRMISRDRNEEQRREPATRPSENICPRRDTQAMAAATITSARRRFPSRM